MGSVEAGDAAEHGAPGRLRRLVLVTPSYYPDVAGGAERQATILAEALARRGVSVTLLAPTLRGGGAASEAAAFGRIERFRLGALPARGGRYLLSTVSWTARVAAWLRRHRAEYQLIYVFHGRLHVLGPLLGGKLSRRPVFVKPGGGGANADYAALHAKRFLYGHLVAALVTRWTAGFVAISREIEGDLGRAGVERSRIHPISNGVQLPTPPELERAQRGRTGRRFVFASRLVHDKNIELLLEAVALCREDELEFTLLGDGPARGALEARAAALGVADRVRFAGAREDVYPELLAHDFFLSGSLREGQSNALLEALATGLIPVAALASGVVDLVEDGETGFLVPEPTPLGFATAIQRALGLSPAERRRISGAVHALAADRLDIDRVAERVHRTLSAALDARAG